MASPGEGGGGGGGGEGGGGEEGGGGREEKEEKKVSLTSQLTIASSHPVSVTMNNLAGFENYCISPFSRNAFSDEDIKAVSIACGGSHEPSVLTVWIHYIINGTSRQLFGKESGPRRGSSISKS